jgi:hypothetical protein
MKKHKDSEAQVIPSHVGGGYFVVVVYVIERPLLFLEIFEYIFPIKLQIHGTNLSG